MTNFLTLIRWLSPLLLIVSSYSSFATETTTEQNRVKITDAWVRPMQAGQSVGVAYLTLSSAQNVTLLCVSSSVADSVEIHNMWMEKGVMKMRLQDNLPIPAGKPVRLAPGGLHLMLFDLKKPLTLGSSVDFNLHFQTKNKVLFTQDIQVKVQASAPSPH